MGSPGFGPIPGAQDQQPPAGPDVLAGESGADKSEDTQSRSRAFTSQIREVHTDLDNLARQYPDMSEACGKAKSLLTDAMVKHIEVEGRSSKGAMPPVATG